jgi:anti-anti-sigma factor
MTAATDSLADHFPELPATLIRAFRKGNALIIRFVAKSVVDPMALEKLQGQIEAVVKRETPTVLAMDMAGVEFISSRFLGLLVATHKALKAIGVPMRLCSASAAIARSLKQAHLDRVLDIRADVDAALADGPASAPTAKK